VSSSATWLDGEPALWGVAHREVRRLIGRASRRPLATLGVALLLAIAVFGLQARRRPWYEAEVGLLITEGAFAEDGRPRPQGQIRAFVNQAVLSSPALDTLIRKHDLVTKLQTGTEEETRDLLRKRIEVHTWHNYFEGYRQRVDPPRTARVTIAFSAPDPDLALAVSRSAGELVAKTQTQWEAEIANTRVEGLRVLAEKAAEEAALLEAQWDRARGGAWGQSDALSQEGLHRLSLAVQQARDRAKAAAANLVDAQLRAHAVRQIDDIVQVANSSVPPWRTMSPSKRLVRQIALALFVACFSSVVLVGAMETKVWDETDIRRTGLEPLGTITLRTNKSSQAGV